MEPQVTLRPARPEDAAFLRRVYASTRAAELQLLDWTEEQKQSFVNLQFNAQQQDYHRNYPWAEYSILILGGTPIGQMITDRGESKILLIDVALLAEFRNQGVGTILIKNLTDEAIKTGKPLRLTTHQFSQSQRLYSRLGFKITGQNEIYVEMEWDPFLPTRSGSTQSI